LQSGKRSQGGDGNFLRITGGFLVVVVGLFEKRRKMMMLVEEDEEEETVKLKGITFR
jgi:hypothetical protein